MLLVVFQMGFFPSHFSLVCFSLLMFWITRLPSLDVLCVPLYNPNLGFAVFIAWPLIVWSLLDAKFDMFLVRTVAFIGRTVCTFV